MNHLSKNLSVGEAERGLGIKDREYGDNIIAVTDALGKKLNYTINKTMMRVELPQNEIRTTVQI